MDDTLYIYKYELFDTICNVCSKFCCMLQKINLYLPFWKEFATKLFT